MGGGLLLAAIITAGGWAQSSAVERYDADLAASRLTVEGTSTLHHWTVAGNSIGGSLIVSEQDLVSLWEHSGLSTQPLTPTVRVEIPVTSLTSGKRQMDDKMHEALKAKTHPTITYRLESARIPPRQTAQTEDTGEHLAIDTTGALTVAGVARTLDIPMRVRRLSENRLEVSGDTPLRMTEFGIEPPKAMLGTIRTGDTVRVHWTWVLARGRIDGRDVQ
jgi:polyisoprenoid-binding protein YceI